MPLPLFFIEENSPDAGFLTLNEETSKHIVQSLRMKIGEPLMLTNGKGYLITAEISDDHKKRCMVKVNQSTFVEKMFKCGKIPVILFFICKYLSFLFCWKTLFLTRKTHFFSIADFYTCVIQWHFEFFLQNMKQNKNHHRKRN